MENLRHAVALSPHKINILVRLNLSIDINIDSLARPISPHEGQDGPSNLQLNLAQFAEEI